MNGIAIINNSDNQYTWLFIRSNMTPLVGDFNFTTLLLYSVVITGPLLLSLLPVPHSCLNKTPRCDNFHKQMHLSVSVGFISIDWFLIVLDTILKDDM